MLCDIYGNAMLYFYYAIVTFFFHGGKMCRILSIPWGGTIYSTIFHPVRWTKSGTLSIPRGQKSFCAGFCPSSGVENVPDFVHLVGETANVTVKSLVKKKYTQERDTHSLVQNIEMSACPWPAY